MKKIVFECGCGGGWVVEEGRRVKRRRRRFSEGGFLSGVSWGEKNWMLSRRG
jgi:hypothetical protein